MKQVFLILPAFVFFSFASQSKKETPASPAYVQDYNAGVKAQKGKDYETAIFYYQKALDQKSDFADAWNNLGYCNRMIAKSYLAKAGSAYAKAVKYEPKHEEALEYQGEYFIMVGELSEAYENYQTLKSLNSKEADELKEKLDAILNQAQKVQAHYTP